MTTYYIKNITHGVAALRTINGIINLQPNTVKSVDDSEIIIENIIKLPEIWKILNQTEIEEYHKNQQQMFDVRQEIEAAGQEYENIINGIPLTEETTTEETTTEETTTEETTTEETTTEETTTEETVTEETVTEEEKIKINNKIKGLYKKLTKLKDIKKINAVKDEILQLENIIK